MASRHDLSQTITERRITTAFANIKHIALAEALDCDRTTAVKKLQGGRGIQGISELATILDVAGLQVVGAGEVVIDRQEYDALLYYAKQGMDRLVQERQVSPPDKQPKMEAA